MTRLAALKVLEQLRPADTVTICLPLFLAGGEGDRAFAKFYPTIAIDGCDKRCAARGTEMYSGKPAASIVVTELVAESSLGKPEGKRRLNEAGRQAVEATAAKMAGMVDELLQKHWNRTTGAAEETGLPVVQAPVQATCSCGSGIPIQDIQVNGQTVTLIALPLIFQQAVGCRQTSFSGNDQGIAGGGEDLQPNPARRRGSLFSGIGARICGLL